MLQGIVGECRCQLSSVAPASGTPDEGTSSSPASDLTRRSATRADESHPTLIASAPASVAVTNARAAERIGDAVAPDPRTVTDGRQEGVTPAIPAEMTCPFMTSFATSAGATPAAVSTVLPNEASEFFGEMSPPAPP